jgi:localization factor PodJL
MRSDLPWNVAGIPPEAREAARAAARREGLSVGEWLTRRILRSVADAGSEDDLTRESLNASKIYRPEEQVPPSHGDTADMLNRVTRTEAESNDVWRRIEEQLRGVARKMETQERSQSESHRAMNRAATEMNIATREQSQAFDQLGAHVVGLTDRLDRVERANNGGGLKDAVKALHTGLSRLADQMTQNANQSATQVSSLVSSLESVVGRLNEARQEAEGTAQAFEHRIVTLDERIHAIEISAQTNSAVLEALQARAHDDSESEHTPTAAAIARLEENIARFEVRAMDPEVDHRLGGIERSLSNLLERLESQEPAAAKAIEDSVGKLISRVEATENRQRDTASEFRAALNETALRLAALENKAAPAPFPPPQAATFGSTQPVTAPPPAFDPPPFPDVPTPGAPPPFQAQTDPFLPPMADDLPPFVEEEAFDPAPGFATEHLAPEPPVTDSYLSAARRSARAAANAAEAEQASRSLGWGTGAASSDPGSAGGRTRMVLIGFAVLIAVALIAGIVLSQGFFAQSPRPSGLGAVFSPKPQTAPASQPGTPLHALSTQADETAEQTPPAPAPTMLPESNPVVLPPAQQKTVAAAPVSTPAPHTTAQSAAIPALDRLTALANGRNSKAELIVGLKYLNGDGVAVNEVQGAKWLERAAESGEPVAQYRLGTLYEHGKGVAVDPAKATHWYQAAAMQGNRKAMHNLAVAFAEGTGLKKDYAEAARWFSKAASLGLTDSQFNLAVLYERGQGVPQSLLDAYKWYAIAAVGGDTESKSRIEALATQISADDRAAAQHAADSFRPVPADPHANIAPQQSELPKG